MQEIPPGERGERLQGGDETPLAPDIRHGVDFEQWHITNSLKVDVTVCATRVVARTATGVLSEFDYDAVRLTDELELGLNNCTVE